MSSETLLTRTRTGRLSLRTSPASTTAAAGRRGIVLCGIPSIPPVAAVPPHEWARLRAFPHSLTRGHGQLAGATWQNVTGNPGAVPLAVPLRQHLLNLRHLVNRPAAQLQPCPPGPVHWNSYENTFRQSLFLS